MVVGVYPQRTSYPSATLHRVRRAGQWSPSQKSQDFAAPVARGPRAVLVAVQARASSTRHRGDWRIALGLGALVRRDAEGARGVDEPIADHDRGPTVRKVAADLVDEDEARRDHFQAARFASWEARRAASEALSRRDMNAFSERFATSASVSG